jgi:membrane protease YdiL (CAAX protease family)
MQLYAFAVGSLILLGLIWWLTYRSGQLLRELEASSPEGLESLGNLLLSPPENAFRLLLIVACLGLGQVSGLPARRLGWVTTAPVHDLVWGLALGIGTSLLLFPLTRWAVSRFGPELYSPLVLRNILPRNRQEWVLVPLAFAPAALLEELLFRSLLLGGFSVFLPPVLLAVAGSALFGLMHLPQGWLGAAMAGLLGLGLCVLFLWRGTLLTPLAAHYAINVAQMVQAGRQPEVWAAR